MEAGIVTIALLVAGALLSVWVNEHAKRPKLGLQGGFRSVGPASAQPSLMTLTIANVPGFIGLRLGKTVIFGKPVHGPIEKGTEVERRSAISVRVAISEEDTRGPGVPLWMIPQLGDDEEGVPTQSASLANGEYATVYVVTRRPTDNGFFVGHTPNGLMTSGQGHSRLRTTPRLVVSWSAPGPTA